MDAPRKATPEIWSMLEDITNFSFTHATDITSRRAVALSFMQELNQYIDVRIEQALRERDRKN